MITAISTRRRDLINYYAAIPAMPE